MDALVGDSYKLDENIICISYLLGPARMSQAFRINGDRINGLFHL